MRKVEAGMASDARFAAAFNHAVPGAGCADCEGIVEYLDTMADVVPVGPVDCMFFRERINVIPALWHSTARNPLRAAMRDYPGTGWFVLDAALPLKQALFLCSAVEGPDRGRMRVRDWVNCMESPGIVCGSARGFVYVGAPVSAFAWRR